MYRMDIGTAAKKWTNKDLKQSFDGYDIHKRKEVSNVPFLFIPLFN